MRIALAVTALLGLIWAEPAFACGCIGSTPTTETYRAWLKSFDGEVFRGTAVESELVRGVGTKVTFRIERHWKGAPSAEVVLYTPYGTSCDVRFESGRVYLVAASRENGRLTYDSCLELFTSQNEAALLEALGKGTSPPAPSPR